MYGIVVQIAILVATTQGLRVLGHLAGPRRCGLLLGLPSTTTLLLIYCGQEHGVVEALTMVESSLLGLVAAAMMPLAYAWAMHTGSCWLRAPSSAIAAYVAIASVFRILPEAGAGAGACVGLSVAGVLAACSLAERVRIVGREPGSRARRWPWYRPRELAMGTAVPAALVVAVKTARTIGGVGWAGLFTTFPIMSLTVLVAIHREAGAASACRMAKAMPFGNLITIVFLAAFRAVGPRLGLVWGIACGYAVALSALLALEALSRAPAAGPRDRDLRRPPQRRHAAASAPPRPPRHALRFAPLVETIPG